MNHRPAARSYRLRVLLWTLAGILLALPLIAMQFTDEVVWTGSDFLIFGSMLLAAGLTGEFVVRRSTDTLYRTAFGGAIATTFLLFWVSGAVGIIGSEDTGANVMYVAVFAIAIFGSIIVRFRARSMSRVIFAAGAVQALIAMVALAGGWGSWTENWPRDIIGATIVFCALWFASAALFREAALRQEEASGG